MKELVIRENDGDQRLDRFLKKLFKSTKVIDKNYTKRIIYEIDISKGDI